MERKLTRKEAEEAFYAVAALREQIAFGWLREGCECRAQLMIEHLQGMGLEPGRVWAISVGRMLTFPHPKVAGQTFKWGNHVAPVLAVEGPERGILVIDPALSQTGPLTLSEWMQTMKVKSAHVTDSGLSEAEILTLQSERVLQGEELDAVVFILKLGEPPLVNRGGSGFCIGPDPAMGIGRFARETMRDFLTLQNRLGFGKP
jgi:hypothetical protein